jgi:RNA polymerase sigma factor (sigma-70 family)
MLALDLFEKWTEKYKRSIDCSNPKGFSQQAHCDGKKKTNEEQKHDLDLMEGFRQLLPIACKHLNITKLPKIHLCKKQTGTHQASFGGYDPNTQEISIGISNRHPVDVLRTLAHELVHYKQDCDSKLVDDSWMTGSDAENEANSEAGIIMRLFNKANPEFMAVKPIVEDINAKIDLKKALDHLPEKEKEMIIMRMYHDATYAEIAREFNVTPQTVRMRIAKGLRLLRQMRHSYTSGYVPKDLKRVGDDHWQRPFDEVPIIGENQ